MSWLCFVLRKDELFFLGCLPCSLTLLCSLCEVPASVVNSGIKYMSTILQLNFRQRLSRHLHNLYLNGMAFYRASNVGSKIDNMYDKLFSLCGEILADGKFC